jgi:hypothetical protein
LRRPLVTSEPRLRSENTAPIPPALLAGAAGVAGGGGPGGGGGGGGGGGAPAGAADLAPLADSFALLNSSMLMP